MIRWWKGIWEDIREKTAQMDKGQKLEYIAAYYWYHILFVLAGFLLLILLIRHLFFREPPKEFTCVMINQAVDYSRDAQMGEDFAAVSGILPERISIDSDYVFSYVGKVLEGVNESSYEKFFFRWGNAELDAVLMQESFYKYCKGLEYEFADIGAMLSEEQKSLCRKKMLSEGDKCDGLYVKDTHLEKYLEQEEEDPVILVFLQDEQHKEANRAFLKFMFGQ